MTEPLEHLQRIFPDLASAGYSPKSEKSRIYNCIAYVAGDETRKWAGYREVGYYWPEGAKEGYTLEALISAFERLEYAICNSDAVESEYEKIALYVDQDGLWTHAAKQCEDANYADIISSSAKPGRDIPTRSNRWPRSSRKSR